MALTRCPQCGRVADPPSCFACGFEWSTEVQAAPAAVPAATDEWSVPAQGSAPLKTKSAANPTVPAVPEEIPLIPANPFADDAPVEVPEVAPAEDVNQISDSLDELGDIFGGAVADGASEIGFSDVPLPDISGMGNDLDGAISELEDELAAAAVPMAPEQPQVVAGVDESDIDLSGLPAGIFGEDEGPASAEIPSLLPEVDDPAAPAGLPEDLFAALDEPPPGGGVPPGVPTLDAPPTEMPDPDLDGLGLDDLADLDLGEDVPEPAATPDEAPAAPRAVVDETETPEAPATPVALSRESAAELAGFVDRVEEFAENFENEGRIGEAAFLYELKAFLDTLN